MVAKRANSSNKNISWRKIYKQRRQRWKGIDGWNIVEIKIKRESCEVVLCCESKQKKYR